MFEYWLLQYRRVWRGTAITSIVNPIFYLGALGDNFSYAAAVNGHFFQCFARLHPRGRFPHIGLLVLGGLSMLASLWPLDAVISALLTSLLALVCRRLGRSEAQPITERHGMSIRSRTTGRS